MRPPTRLAALQFDQPSKISVKLGFRQRVALVMGVTAAVVVGTFLIPPIHLPPEFEYSFADTRSALGIPNFFNVVSNIPFFIVGALGLLTVFRRDRSRGGTEFREDAERWIYAVLFAGVELTAFGSCYFHWSPNAWGLLWDRMPMVIGFGALIAVIVAERISVFAGVWLLAPLVFAGFASVVSWHQQEQRGAGDLRFYGLIQFSPALIIPLLIWLFPPQYTRTADWCVALGWYVLAKFFEAFDAQVYALGNILSGHTVKHLLAAVGAYWILRMVKKRSVAATISPANQRV